MSSLALSEKNLKEKWLRNYQEEIYLNKEKRENERMKKLVEEKEHLEKIRFELEEENRRKLLKKQNLMYDNQQEFEKYQQKKKLEEQRNLNEKLENQKSLSLPIQHEERIESYKNLINKLNDKIDSNVHNYKQFTSNNNNYNNTRLSASHNFEGMNPDKDGNMNYNEYGANMQNNYYGEAGYNQGDNRTPDYINSYNNPSNNSNNYHSHLNSQNPGYDTKGGYLDNIYHQNANEYKNLERLKKLEKEEKNFMREQQKVYREILDSQVKTKAYGGLMNPYFQNNSSNSHNQYLNSRNNNSNNYANYNSGSNQHDELLSANISNLNPTLFYNNDLDRKFNLGQTKLNHNPIVNPVPDFKYNKYLYRDSPPRSKEQNYPNPAGHIGLNNNLSRSLVMTGNNVIS